jgi:hypothetical protein
MADPVLEGVAATMPLDVGDRSAAVHKTRCPRRPRHGYDDGSTDRAVSR